MTGENPKGMVVFRHESVGDVGYLVGIDSGGHFYAEREDGHNNKIICKSGDMKMSKAEQWAQRIISSVGDLEMKATPRKGYSETVMRVEYRGEGKGIGYNGDVPNEGLEELKNEFIAFVNEKICGTEPKSLYLEQGLPKKT